MPDWLAEQTRRNRASRDSWEAFAGHRGQVTALLTAAAAKRTEPRLCLLGAGNCHDVDLHSLLDVAGQIHLVDIDADALRTGIERQSLSGQKSLILHGGVDLRGDPPDFPAGPFDVVASLCLLSQLIESVLTGNPSDVVPLHEIQAIRRRHLELLVNLLQPGGVGLLVSDVVSSDTAPHLVHLPPEQFSAFVAQCIQQRNFFTGLNPAVVLNLLQCDPWFGERIDQIEPINPWKWDLGLRCYAVYALRFHRREES